ncbi:MAG: hypothetical protein SFY80_10360 [Verrucomicrobiota bacterium]|nr:hypothetical protein [Verrucomicrobiota bacterium]
MARALFDNTRLDRSLLVKEPLSSQGIDSAYWLAQTPEQRLIHLEYLRQHNFDYDPDTSRFRISAILNHG